MRGTIFNASNVPLNQSSGSFPNVSDVITDWMTPLTFGLITKRTVNFQLVEYIAPINFEGVIQPLSKRDLQIKPTGQRAWSWWRVHSTPALTLKVDDRIRYLEVNYRVMAVWLYDANGYREYEIVQDWERCGVKQ